MPGANTKIVLLINGLGDYKIVPQISNSMSGTLLSQAGVLFRRAAFNCWW